MSEHAVQPQEPLELRPEQGQKLSVVLLALTGIGAALCLAGFAASSKQFFFSYLVAFIFVIQIATGALFWVVLHHMVDAGWSVVVRRISENLARVLIYAGVLVIPVLAGLTTLYSWTAEPEDEHLKHLLHIKEPWLNVPFFIIRTVIYFAVWALIAWKFTEWSKEQDKSRDPALTRKMQLYAPLAMVFLGLTAAFAGIDWIMTLDWEWFSTMFGVYFWAGAFISSICTITLIVVMLRKNGLLTNSITEEHLHDLGKLMFAFTIFWAYITFSQYMLTWYADIPEETAWFSKRRWIGHDMTHRHIGSWHWVGVFIVFAHVIVPFLVLLPRASKRNPNVLGCMAVWILTAHVLEIHWQVVPTSQPSGEQSFNPSWIDLAPLAALVGAAGFVALREFKNKPILAKGDPRLQESLTFQNI